MYLTTALYLTTGELARLFNLNKQTLFYYDKEQLLIPEIRDADTGYRKYRFEQIYRLALICYLRKIGFSIQQDVYKRQVFHLSVCQKAFLPFHAGAPI